ncbi:MAG: flagella basal body P-ring formation protein FlgA, partial [Deltaproteobacteria bacterium]|nr:flagella basal body P-ring formation protein FlgA [Deltaproteobacteria bacterium]
IRVTALGIAQGGGSVGDQICVRNCLGKKEIFASIVDSSTVKIDF